MRCIYQIVNDINILRIKKQLFTLYLILILQIIEGITNKDGTFSRRSSCFNIPEIHFKTKHKENHKCKETLLHITNSLN